MHFDEVFSRHKNDDNSDASPSRPSNHGNNRKSKNAMFHPGFRHHDSFASLIAARKDGCELCSLLERVVSDHITDRGEQSGDGNILSTFLQERTPMYIRAPWPFVGSVGSLRCTFPGSSQPAKVDANIRVFCELGEC